ncbi:MAG TPA: RNA polymerase sigma factor [Polyangia bacterium]|nr:RNA polymerase sigma factor [Polyangia bacterium]
MDAKSRTTSATDVELVAAVVRGEGEALGALFDRHHHGVYRFLTRLSGTDSGDLDDLVQNTFVRLVDAAPRFAGQASVRSWILAIASHVAHDHIRAEIRRRKHVRAGDLAPLAGPDRPDQRFEGREALARFQRALDGLSHELRVAYIMCELEDSSGRDAASALGIPEGTLWRRLHDARKALLGAMSDAPVAVKEASNDSR